jgi:hypothetical protein
VKTSPANLPPLENGMPHGEFQRWFDEELRRRIERGELTRTEDPEAARLAQFYGVVPATTKGKAAL